MFKFFTLIWRSNLANVLGSTTIYFNSIANFFSVKSKKLFNISRLRFL